MALWRARTVAPEKKSLSSEEQENQESLLAQYENNSSHFYVENSKMSKIYSTTLPVDVSA